jgi:hypothetical protein
MWSFTGIAKLTTLISSHDRNGEKSLSSFPVDPWAVPWYPVQWLRQHRPYNTILAEEKEAMLLARSPSHSSPVVLCTRIGNHSTTPFRPWLRRLFIFSQQILNNQSISLRDIFLDQHVSGSHIANGKEIAHFTIPCWDKSLNFSSVLIVLKVRVEGISGVWGEVRRLKACQCFLMILKSTGIWDFVTVEILLGERVKLLLPS